MKKRSGRGLRATRSILNHLSIEESDLSYGNFSEAKLSTLLARRSRFTHAVARGALFENSHLADDNFSDAILDGAWFDSSQIRRGVFRHASLRDSLFSHTTCLECDFRDADLSGAVFLLVDLRGSMMNRATKLPFSRETALKMGLRFVED